MTPLWTTATAAIAADVRMGVAIGGGAVRGPARVADADAAGRRLIAEMSGQFGDAAGPFAEVQMRAGQRRHAGAVVAAILQPAQPFDEDRLRLSIADVTDDAAHACSSVNRWGGVIRVRCGKSEFTAIPHSRTRGFPSEKATIRFHKPAHHGFIRLRDK